VKFTEGRLFAGRLALRRRSASAKGTVSALDFRPQLGRRLAPQCVGVVHACLEEIAIQQGWIGVEDLRDAAAQLCKSGYAAYLVTQAKERTPE